MPAGWGFRGRCSKCSVGYVSGICGRSGCLKKFNLSLNEDINIRFVSITETCTHASRTYLSTLAVLQLDAILTNAKVVSTVGSKNNGNQKPFEKMIIMKYDCVGIGVIKMTVGVRRRTHEKVQYCITALQIEKDAIMASL